MEDWIAALKTVQNREHFEVKKKNSPSRCPLLKFLPSELLPCVDCTSWNSRSQHVACKVRPPIRLWPDPLSFMNLLLSSPGHVPVICSSYHVKNAEVCLIWAVLFLLPADPVQHGPLLRDAQLVRLFPREADLLQRVSRGPVWGHVPRTVLWRYERCVILLGEAAWP